jgi:hypothetical protein
MSYRSKVYYTGTGSEQNLTVTFPYLDVTHVNVSFYNPTTDEYDTQERTSWSWLNSSTITLTNPDTSTDGVLIWRSTGFDPLVTFTNATLLNEDDQNMAALQAIYLLEEGADATTDLETLTASIDVANRTVAISFLITGGNDEISAEPVGDIEIPFDCTLTEARLLADQTGSIAVSLWVDSYDNFPPTVADLLDTFSISSGVKSYEIDLAHDLSTGDIIRVNVDSCTTITEVTLCLTLVKS